MADLIKRTLDDVNDVRTSVGFGPLPALRPGKVGDSCRCPVANSLREVYEAKGENPEIEDTYFPLPSAYASVLEEKWWVTVDEDEDYWNGTPVISLTGKKSSFGDFISEFDNGKFPELNEDIVGPATF